VADPRTLYATGEPVNRVRPSEHVDVLWPLQPPRYAPPSERQRKAGSLPD
jgi:hypothetical protein